MNKDFWMTIGVVVIIAVTSVGVLWVASHM